MYIQIRQGVFETNSSSSHSISVSTRDQLEDLSNYPNDTIVLTGGEYGWGYEVLSDWFEKLNYLAIEANNDDYKQELLQKAVNKHLSREVKLVYDIAGWAYIDHQSAGEIWSEVFYQARAIENTEEDVVDIFVDFIFNEKWSIIIDNDNH